MELYDLVLPDKVKMKMFFDYLTGDSYSVVTVSDGGGLNGVYDGWCADVDRGITEHKTYPAEVWNTYDPALL